MVMRAFFLLAFLFLFIPNLVFADAKSDFEYQFSKYRDSYVEYRLFKKDYLSTPTLDNQQKALLAAKQSLNTRDLAKASFATYIRDLTVADKINYPVLNPILNDLVAAQSYYLTESNKSLALVTLADIDAYDKNYIKTYQDPEQAIKLGIVASKIAKLKYFHLQQEASLKSLKNKLSTNLSARVSERIIELETGLQTIGNKIDTISNFLVSPEGKENTESEIFFTARIEPISEIRTLQLDWMDLLIDLDLNYGKI